MSERHGWPALPSDVWSGTLETVQLWTQVIGKIRMVQSPWINHSWSVTLYVSPRGLRTSLVPHGTEGFEWAFDFLEHHVDLTTTRAAPHDPARTDDGGQLLRDRPRRDGRRGNAGDDQPDAQRGRRRHPVPRRHRARLYQPDHIHAWWRAALQSARVFTGSEPAIGARPVPSTSSGAGSISPSPGSPDGLRRPTEAVCPTSPLTSPAGVLARGHERRVLAWHEAAPMPIFYVYAYPTPEGFAEAAVSPPEASWSASSGSSCCRPTPSPLPTIRTRTCCRSSSRPMPPPPTRGVG